MLYSLPTFYKTAYKTGTPYLLSCFAMTLFVIITEGIIQLVPGLKATLDTTSLAYFPQQITVLFAGIILFVLLTAFAYIQSVKRFEKLDL